MKYLTVLIHGLEGSRNDWFDRNGYTKGGYFTDELNAMGYPFVAYDLYGHGDWKADEPDFDPSNIDDDTYPKFVYRSAERISELIRREVCDNGYGGINFVTYSAGCVPGVKILERLKNIDIGQIIMCVPSPERDYDDEFSMHNNLEVFRDRNVSIFMGMNDEYIPSEDTEFFFRLLCCRYKALYRYKSGHALPLAWVEAGIAVLKAGCR